MPRRRFALAVAILAPLLAACPFGLARRTASTPPSPTASSSSRSIGAGLMPSRSAATSPRPAPSQTMGTLEILVRDRTTGVPRSDIPIRLTRAGTAPTVRTTGANGVMRARLEEGRYRAEIVDGCAERVFVTFAPGASVGVTAGMTTRGELRASAVRRFAAGPPSHWSESPPWRRGAAVEFYFRLIDRCSDDLARNQRFDDLRFMPSGTIEVVRSSMRSNDEAYATVVIRCRGRGDASLRLADPQHPDDGEDLFEFRPPPRPGDGWCA